MFSTKRRVVPFRAKEACFAREPCDNDMKSYYVQELTKYTNINYKIKMSFVIQLLNDIHTDCKKQQHMLG